MTSAKIEKIYQKINKLREEKDVLILAHLYQPLEIQHIADFCGDSFELAKRAKASDKKNIIFCGVKFMAESAKIINPDKHIFAPVKDAGCAMADMITARDIEALKAQYPCAAVVCYINSSAETKALCDMCVTSSNALKIVKNMPQKEIIFVPDKNLGSFIAENVPEKDFHIYSGYCPVHQHITAQVVKKVKEEHPDALFLVHPECEAEVVKMSDFAGSTSGIIDYAQKSDAKSFIIGTERAVFERLSEECPDKEFILLSDTLVCKDMKLVTLDTLLDTIQKLDDEVVIDKETMDAARICLENMLEAGSVK